MDFKNMDENGYGIYVATFTCGRFALFIASISDSIPTMMV